MDNIMIGDLVLLIHQVKHPTLGIMPRYTLACALKRNDDGSWQLGVTGFGEATVPRDAFQIYTEKSIMRYEMAQRRDAYIAGADDDLWSDPR